MAPVRRPPPAIRATLRPPKLVYGWEGDGEPVRGGGRPDRGGRGAQEVHKRRGRVAGKEREVEGMKRERRSEEACE